MKLQEGELDTLPLAHTTKTMVAGKDFLLLQYFPFLTIYPYLALLKTITKKYFPLSNNEDSILASNLLDPVIPAFFCFW